MALIRLSPLQTKIRNLRVLTTELELSDTLEETERLIQSIRVTLREIESEAHDPSN